MDKALVDEVPKIFAMMLVMRTVDFLNGGEQIKTVMKALCLTLFCS